MKIALLSYEYPPETGFGGIGTYTWYHARALVKLGHDVHVLAGATEKSRLRSMEHDGVTVHRFRSDSRWLRPVKLLDLGKMWWTRNRIENAFNIYFGFRELAERNNYDLVEMPECGAEGLLVNRLLPHPTVVRLHSPAKLIMELYGQGRGDIFCCSFLEQRGINCATALSSCSNFIAGEVRDKLGVKDPITVISNGIDLQLFDSAGQIDFRRKFQIPDDRLMILFSGRMEQRKGIHLCLEIAAAILREYPVAFVFAGQDLFGYMTDELLPYLTESPLKGSVHYLGKLDQTDVRSAVSQCDIFIIPSVWENCPYSCLEAMAAGRAVVGSDQGGMPELITHGENGLLACSGDTASYVDALVSLIDDPGLREQLGDAARRTVALFHTDTYIAEASLKLYKQCLSGTAYVDRQLGS